MINSTAATLVNIGFDEHEATIYLALLELGEGTATQIAERAHLKRTLTYETLNRLITQGYATEIPRTKVKRYTASDPSKLVQNVQTNFENLKFMLPLLRAMHNKSLKKPRIEFYEGNPSFQPPTLDERTSS